MVHGDQDKFNSYFHGAQVLGLIIPLGGLLGSWLVSQSRKPLSEEEQMHFRMVVNFQLSVVVASALLVFITGPYQSHALVLASAISSAFAVFNTYHVFHGKEAKYPLFEFWRDPTGRMTK